MDDHKTLAERYVDSVERGNLGVRTRLQNELWAEVPSVAMGRTLGKVALWYARHGIAVFPCLPRDKRPAGHLAPRGLHDATLDEATVVGWWQAEPQANIGAPTGHTFDVIDIDGPDGIAATYGRDDLTFPPRPEIGHVLTSRLGGHHVFIEPTGRGNTQGLYPSVDFRGAGGYVVLPPSIGANGFPYRWARPLDVMVSA